MSFWGSATEGFNQGLAEAMRRAAEKRQRDFAIQTRNEEWTRQERRDAAAREQALADREWQRNVDDPMAEWIPSAPMDPIGAALNPSLLGQARRRSDVEFDRKGVLQEAQMRAIDEDIAASQRNWEVPSGSVAVPAGTYGGLAVSGVGPDGKPVGFVPGSLFSGRSGGGGGGGSPLNQLVDVPLTAIDPQYQPLFAELVDENGIVQMPRSQQLRVVIEQKPQVASEGDAYKALGRAFGKYDKNGDFITGMIPAVVDQNMPEEARAAFAAAYTDVYTKTASQQEAINAAYGTIKWREYFPMLSVSGTSLKWNKPRSFDKSYSASDFDAFYKEFGGSNKLSRDLAQAIFNQFFVPAAEQGATADADSTSAKKQDIPASDITDAEIDRRIAEARAARL